MSRRFGRNQRRRAREALAQATEAAQTLTVERDNARADVNRKLRAILALEGILAGVRDALGPETVALEPVRREMANYVLGDRILLAEAGPLPDFPGPDAMRAHFQTITADVLNAVVYESHAARRIHFGLLARGGPNGMELAYVVDPRVFYQKNGIDVVTRHVAKMMAEQFRKRLMDELPGRERG